MMAVINMKIISVDLCYLERALEMAMGRKSNAFQLRAIEK